MTGPGARRRITVLGHGAVKVNVSDAFALAFFAKSDIA